VTADQPCRCNLCRVLLELAREAEANHQAATQKASRANCSVGDDASALYAPNPQRPAQLVDTLGR